MKPSKLETVLWDDVKERVRSLDPKLADAIDAFNPGSAHPLFKATYPYGAEILKDGMLQIPNQEGKLIPLDHADVPSAISDALSYNYFSNPVTFILNNSLELFFIHEDMIVSPSGLLKPGALFGTSLVLNFEFAGHPQFLWSIVAGSRSLFMLPKISESMGFQKLNKTYNLQSRKPTHLIDQWAVFREIANHPDFTDPWETELLFFPKSWFDWSERSTQPFRLALFERSWRSTDFNRNQFVWNVIFSVFQTEKLVRVNPYAFDTLKQIISLAMGSQPGFVPALNNLPGPVAGIQAVFRDLYRIEYAPVMLSLEKVEQHRNTPLYYSLEYHTGTEFSPNNRRISTKISDLAEIKMLLRKFLTFIKRTEFNISGPIMHDLQSKIEFDFFHNHGKDYPDIFPIEQIFEEDHNFEKAGGLPALPMAQSASFLNGCIRIKRHTDL
jgi:hypothetical protein